MDCSEYIWFHFSKNLQKFECFLGLVIQHREYEQSVFFMLLQGHFWRNSLSVYLRVLECIWHMTSCLCIVLGVFLTKFLNANSHCQHTHTHTKEAFKDIPIYNNITTVVLLKINEANRKCYFSGLLQARLKMVVNTRKKGSKTSGSNWNINVLAKSWFVLLLRLFFNLSTQI